MDVVGIFDERYDDLENLSRARRLPSIQLVGSAARRTLDLNALTAMGVKLVGRLAGICHGKAQFAG
jgi:putative flavoprotein involved in K+ transport